MKTRTESDDVDDQLIGWRSEPIEELILTLSGRTAANQANIFTSNDCYQQTSAAFFANYQWAKTPNLLFT